MKGASEIVRRETLRNEPTFEKRKRNKQCPGG